ncbi:phospholipase D-like domain-containing protein [Bacillus cereus]|uniref:phospholipase D-like domain-containing protein n=1 Tax=Bacillus cereus TaxID=1396 RepID=UPI0028AB0660|nr:phospholipase D-like domain-containing protein [Bacillus cereus]WNM98472.1 phospholipase D-like domain-containing protein [Bacillus cereus]
MVSNIEAYFSRPGDICEIKDRLLVDIKHAKERIYVAMAYISDTEILEALYQSSSERKFVLNSQVKKVERFGWQKIVKLGASVEKIGGKDTKSLMHHKFLIIDNILWIGSFNATDYAAGIHWENMIRIEDPKILSRYVIEFNRMFILGKALDQADESYFEHIEKELNTPNGISKHKIDTICKRCKDIPHPANPELSFGGTISEDILNHYYFSIEHSVFETPTFEEYSEVDYKMECAIEVALSHRVISNKGLCELCKDIYNRKSLVNTHFKVLDRYHQHGEIKDKVISKGKEYLFCTQCIFDALTNHAIYDKGTKN